MTINITDYLTEEDKNILCDLEHCVPLEIIIQRYGRNFIVNFDSYMKLSTVIDFIKSEIQ